MNAWEISLRDSDYEIAPKQQANASGNMNNSSDVRVPGCFD